MTTEQDIEQMTDAELNIWIARRRGYQLSESGLVLLGPDGFTVPSSFEHVAIVGEYGYPKEVEMRASVVDSPWELAPQYTTDMNAAIELWSEKDPAYDEWDFPYLHGDRVVYDIYLAPATALYQISLSERTLSSAFARAISQAYAMWEQYKDECI